jgi:hypothetical protein
MRFNEMSRPSALRGGRVGVLVDRPLVERVDDGDRRAAADGRVVRRDALERRTRATGEDDGRALAGEGSRDGAADRPA